MPLPSDYISGTITLTNGSVDFTGTGTGWLAADFREGDIILDIAGGGGRVAVVQSITGNAAGTLSKAWDGPTLTGVAYRIRYQWDSSRVSAQTRTMIEKLGNGNLESFSSVTGPGVVVMDGPHSVIVKPESDFINGVAYDVQVDTLPDRDAYDGQSVGFAVLVSDVGDGRSAIYSKASNTSGDWTDPAYVTGPVGPMPTVEATVTALSPGETATVIVTPIVGGYSFDFELPAAPGFYWESAYNSANAYTKDSVVRLNGSSFIAVQDVPAGTQPSSANPPVDTAYWEVLAAKGANGLGTVTQIVPGTGIDVDNTDPTAPVVSIDPSFIPPSKLPTRFWQGYQHSNNITTPNTKIDIASGSARDSTDTIDIVNAGGTIDLTTVGANGMDTGSLAAGTWYYTFAITTAAGVTAFLASLSPTAPTLPSGYTKFRRVGSFLINGSTQIVPFVHVNDTWYWQTARRDINTGATVGTTFITSSGIGVPRILGVIALGSFTFFAGSGAINAVLMPTFVPDSAADGYAHNVGATGGAIPTRVTVDALSRVKYKSSAASSTFVFDTAGWIDQL